MEDKFIKRVIQVQENSLKQYEAYCKELELLLTEEQYKAAHARAIIKVPDLAPLPDNDIELAKAPVEVEKVSLKVWVTLKDARVDGHLNLDVPMAISEQERFDLLHAASFDWIHGHVGIYMKELKK